MTSFFFVVLLAFRSDFADVSFCQDKDTKTLGEMREAFGDKISDKATDLNKIIEFHCHYGFAEYQTEIYFPDGEWKERFYINIESGRNPFLQYETKKGSTISLEWEIELEAFYSGPVWRPGSGPPPGESMLKMLARRGLRPKHAVRSEISKRLRRSEGFAAYWKPDPHAAFLYWHVDSEGVPAKVYSIMDVIAVHSATPSLPPHMGMPYPITPEELRVIGMR